MMFAAPWWRLTLSESKPRLEMMMTYRPPWHDNALSGWSIVGMNHYHAGGIRLLFVAMARGDYCIKAEGVDCDDLWAQLRAKARRIDIADPPSPRF